MAAYAKAIIASLIAFLTSISTALVDDKSFGDITSGQWVVGVIAFLVALSAVWAVPNKT